MATLQITNQALVFSTAEEAARAYDRAAKQQFGEFARLNFPDEVMANG